MPIKYHYDLIQQSPEWYAARSGILTASDMAKIITAKKLEYAENQTARDHLNELLAQRITGYVEPHFRSDHMLRGLDDEKEAKDIYEKHYGQVKECGFVTNARHGFTIGCSPDGLVGDEGGLQVKSRLAKFQIETIIAGVMPDEFRIQVQTELLVTERKWWDFVSYSGGLHMLSLCIYPDAEVQEAIVTCATEFYARMGKMKIAYDTRLVSGARLVPTVRRPPEQQITI